jgi:hypothetical protein
MMASWLGQPIDHRGICFPVKPKRSSPRQVSRVPLRSAGVDIYPIETNIRLGHAGLSMNDYLAELFFRKKENYKSVTANQELTHLYTNHYLSKVTTLTLSNGHANSHRADQHD